MSAQEQVQQDDEAGSAGGVGRPASVIGVLGAGTMGNGIAQLAARSGARTLLYDPFPQALEKGVENARRGLAKEAEKGKLTDEQATRAAESLQPVDDMAALANCDLVIEAAPERLELKHEMYGELSEIVSQSCVIATNTSSLLVTAIATGATHPERVVGMHFFNPAPLMRLLEVVAGVESSAEALAIAQATGEAMGKTVIVAKDGPGFIVNRCNRPFGLEALRLLQEQAADLETIDRICRMQGGFRMGPFELMDLVGVDTGFEISKSFYEQSFGEPRWRPSMIAARYVAAGLYGRKSGRGYYDYSEVSSAHRAPDPEPLESGSPGHNGEGVVVIAGESVLADELRVAAQAAGYEVRSPHAPKSGVLPSLVLDCEASPVGRSGSGAPDGQPDRRGLSHPQGGARVLLCAQGSLGALDPGGSAVGFHVVGPLEHANLVELTRSESSSPVAAGRAERFFTALGKHTVWVGDAPGLVLGRIVCQLINESAFALGEGVGDARDIDTGMVLGLSHPRGPLEWADAIGLDHVLTVLGALCDEYREERYRPAPELRRMVAAGRLGRETGSGFFDYEV
ncbi:MAG TPA: 3-hydroxyacyl-CoA dehydrogenase NAD-binding domain-containing protein [Solirubrobacteraceae bacterium]|jgi:3-hydroxybutyryl-CoA dehydrogenase|nr:3-hydroxyacyl-CoA dehydrogenase NAD-binding domain-containing protein [Solirubrobacteraceae bacterium]